MTEIKFCKVDEAYGNLSNFARFPIFLDNTFWPTSEHFFQANKFKDDSVKDKIRQTDSPLKAAKIGRSKKNTIRSDWEEVKNDVMLTAIRAKFNQHPELRKQLLLTGDAQLIEHTSRDPYWGDGGDGSGQNMLGKLLMKVRSEIKDVNSDPHTVIPPWVAFNGIGQYDGFWRMGLGEDYISRWSRYYMSLEDKKVYQKMFPESKNWKDIYKI